MLEPNAHARTAEVQPKRQSVPDTGELRVDLEHRSLRSQTGESVCQRLPEAAHRRQVNASGGCSGEVGAVDVRGEAEGFEGLIRPPGSGEQRGVDRGGEGAAV